MALLLLVQAVTAAAPTKQLEVVDTVDVEVATKNSFGCLVVGETLTIMILIPDESSGIFQNFIELMLYFELPSFLFLLVGV